MKFPSGQCHRTHLMESQHWLDKVLVQSDNKPLAEPMLTQSYVAIKHDQATMSQHVCLHGQVVCYNMNNQCVSSCLWVSAIDFVITLQLHLLRTIGSGNGFLPDHAKPLPELVLIYHQLGLMAFILGHSWGKILRYQSIKQYWTLCL